MTATNKTLNEREQSSAAHDPHRRAHLALAIIHGVLAAVLLAEGMSQVPHAACAAGAALVYLALVRTAPRA